jgi:hypothetical protein
MELFSAREVLNLGTGMGSDHQFTDTYYYDPVGGASPSTVTVDGNGTITQQGVEGVPSAYTCVYPLVR